MIDILTNIGWGLAAAVVGVVGVILVGFLIFGPFIGGILLLERLDVKERILRRAQWMRGMGEVSTGIFVLVLLLALSTCMGAALLDWSDDSFGWPDAPGWMNMDTGKKGRCADD